MRRLPLAALAAVLSLSACGLGGPEPIGITGRWEGTITNSQNPSEVYETTLRLRDTGVQVTGTGQVELPGDLFAFAVYDGQFINGLVSLPIQFDRPPFQGSISGRLTQTDPGEISGTFSGSGLANGPFVIELKAR